ncbi:hypothetical protein JOC78_001366 [Bacillus ectoiniformans]|uniref:LamG domain-containing protein n=1 Tax=Bacillus ectoiniformans TaxID=1494429 RepID=UPI0019570F8F|nr:LamG domain-containing protein [Bacillus ectoiniformans]MBM7648424.1 hypothetical protein [Bacillus ectoiniformans]
MHLTFDDTTIDHSGYGNNGTITNPFNISYDEGAVGRAIEFNGFDQRGSVNTLPSPSLVFDKEMTVSYWVRMDSYEGKNGDGFRDSYGVHSIFVKGGETRLINYLYTKDTKRSNLGLPGIGVDALADFTLGTWVHISYVISESSAKAYVNGILTDHEALTAPANFGPSNPYGVTIGWMNNDWYPVNGAVDDFRMYNTALSAIEIQDLYELGD